MSGESGGGWKRDRGCTDYLSVYQKRKKKQQREGQEKKEQAQMRCLDQFYLTSSSPGCGDATVCQSSSTTNAASLGWHTMAITWELLSFWQNMTPFWPSIAKSMETKAKDMLPICHRQFANRLFFSWAKKFFPPL